jgi:hypothetical protein
LANRLSVAVRPSPAERGERLSGDEADVAERLVGPLFAR